MMFQNSSIASRDRGLQQNLANKLMNILSAGSRYRFGFAVQRKPVLASLVCDSNCHNSIVKVKGRRGSQMTETVGWRGASAHAAQSQRATTNHNESHVARTSRKVPCRRGSQVSENVSRRAATAHSAQSQRVATSKNGSQRAAKYQVGAGRKFQTPFSGIEFHHIPHSRDRVKRIAMGRNGLVGQR
jgi:cobalamin biosynthesis Mg chelatase CobN